MVTAGQASDLTVAPRVLDGICVHGPTGRPRTRPKCLLVDAAYGLRPVRAWARKHHVRLVVPARRDVAPRHRPRRFDRKAYGRRNIVERLIGWLKGRRRVGTRHEKLAVNFLAMVNVAILEHHLRALDSPDRT